MVFRGANYMRTMRERGSSTAYHENDGDEGHPGTYWGLM